MGDYIVPIIALILFVALMIILLVDIASMTNC